MPGEASLAAGEYYAYRHNQFWRIVGAICDFEPDAPYARRKASLKKAGIALWDVVESCVRKGSLDSAIRADSIRVNDFAAFLAAHPGIRRVCFNGQKAESAWRRHVAPTLPGAIRFECCRLPSTSPAHAGMSYLSKLRVWRRAIR
jgi:hypoxanthine-DNA glycosylase